MAVLAVCAVVGLAPAANAATRGYELVTPADDGAYEVPATWFPNTPNMQPLSIEGDGESVYFEAGRGNGPSFTFLDGSTAEDGINAVRGPNGWGSTWLTPYCQGVPSVFTSSIDCVGNFGHGENPQPEEGIFSFAGVDGKLLFVTGDDIDPLDQDGNDDLYLGTADGVRHLSRFEDGSHPSSDVSHGGVAWSRDLRTIAWITTDQLLPADTDEGSDVYADIDGELRLISGHENGGPGDIQANIISWEAVQVAADGSGVTFSTNKQLVAEDTDDSHDLYFSDGTSIRQLLDGSAWQMGLAPDGSRVVAWAGDVADGDADGMFDMVSVDTQSGEVTLISPGTEGDNVEPVAVSPDASKAWFWSYELLDGAPDDGNPKLYEGDSGGVSFIASLSSDDRLFEANQSFRPIRSTQDGSVMLFSTSADLLPEQDGNSVADVYRWENDTLSLLTPRVPGAPETDAHLGGRFSFVPFVFGPAMTVDASRVYFTSRTPFSPQDTDGERVDVYEWTSSGIDLITPPGNAPFDHVYAGNSDDGQDVFFGSQQSIVGWDGDGGAADIYDARVGGGFPEPAPAPVPCRGDGCQPTDGAPSAPRVGSFDYTGPGNVDGPQALGARFRVTPVGAAARRQLARRGVATLRVRVGGPGVVRVTAAARVKGLMADVGTARKRAAKASTVRVRLRLASPARRELRSKGRLRLRLTVTFSKAPGSSTAKLTLTKPKGR
jgi:hypothetical protein